MKLSIIIPAYNCEATISKTLDSIFAVKNEEIEVVVVNDGSTDNTLKILKKYQSRFPNILVVDQDNRGLSCARNSGFSSSSGEWVMFLDGDDYLLKEGLEYVLDDLEASTDIVLYPFMLSNNNGYIHNTHDLASNMYGEENVDIKADVLRKMMLGEKYDFNTNVLRRLSYCSYNSSCSRIMRSKLLKEIFTSKDRFGSTELFYESVSSMGEDRFFNIILWTHLDNKSVTLSANTLYYYDVGEKRNSVHLTPSILNHLMPRYDIINNTMKGVYINESEADNLFAKDIWEYFLSTLKIKGEDSRIVDLYWEKLIEENGLDKYFLALPNQPFLMKMNCVFVGRIVRKGWLKIAIKIERFILQVI